MCDEVDSIDEETSGKRSPLDGNGIEVADYIRGLSTFGKQDLKHQIATDVFDHMIDLILYIAPLPEEERLAVLHALSIEMVRYAVSLRTGALFIMRDRGLTKG